MLEENENYENILNEEDKFLGDKLVSTAVVCKRGHVVKINYFEIEDKL